MDFVVRLLKTRLYHFAIWVIMDCLIKLAHFLTIKINDSLDKLARLYKKEIVRQHGIIMMIVFDQDPYFISRFFTSLQKVMGPSYISI